jgi:hypothetical protein
MTKGKSMKACSFLKKRTKKLLTLVAAACPDGFWAP